AGAFVSRGMVRVTFGLFGIYAAYFAARYTARLYRKDSTMAGMTAVIVIMFCAYANNLANNASDHSPFSSSVLKITAVLLALLIGYGVGQIFHWLGKEHKPVDFEHAARIKERAWNAFIPTIFAIFCGIVLGIIIYEFQIKFLNSSTFKGLVTQIQESNNILLIGYGVGQIFHWLGKEHKPVDFEHAARIKERAWNAFIPTIFAIFCGIVLGIIIYEFQIKFLNSSTFKGLVTQIQESNNILL